MIVLGVVKRDADVDAQPVTQVLATSTLSSQQERCELDSAHLDAAVLQVNSASPVMNR